MRSYGQTRIIIDVVNRHTPMREEKKQWETGENVDSGDIRLDHKKLHMNEVK